jgi:flavin-dependent dehydrogenase
VIGLRLTRLGWRVLIFEAGRFDRDRPGETLPPEINPVLRELGLWQRFQAMQPIEAPGIISAWSGFQTHESDFAFNAYGAGWHIDRCRFDRMLFDAAQDEGASVFSAERVEFDRETSGWMVRRRDGTSLFARFAIDATGRNGLRMDESRERTIEDSLIATILRIDFRDTRPRELRTLIEAAPCGWWYSACVPDNGLIAMFFTGRECYRRGNDFVEGQLEAAPMTQSRIAKDGMWNGRTRVVAVSSSLRKQIYGNGCLAAGDSACSFDPLSGRGIFKALRHGAEAAQAVDEALRGNRAACCVYAESVRREFDAYAQQRAAFYAAHSKWEGQPFWQARTRGRHGPSQSAPQHRD